MQALHPAATVQPSPIDQFDSDWYENARYSIYLTEDGDWTKKSQIGSWLTHNEARTLADRLNERLRASGGRVGWASPAYGIQLHTPRILKTAMACVGDLVFIEKVEPFDSYALSEVSIFRRFFIIGIVVAVGSNGISIYRDRDGIHYRAPRNPHVVSAMEVDTEGVLQKITSQIRGGDRFSGEYARPSDASGILVRHQKNQPPVFPAV